MSAFDNNGGIEILKLFLENKTNIDAVANFDDKSALIIASEREKEKIIRFLLKHGANINLQDKESKSALMIACEREKEKIVRFLLKPGADVNFRDKKGNTALTFAQENKHWKIVDVLTKASEKKDPF
ncbi:ankyrin repeat protein [Leptospira weilii serovar Ranarum str. ICFT]|uniref:Ankyrin repeat protein n=2 Tax=Leptospira weilii TaxID=28184 RepID=N1WBF5_9LEPT|nr:ankyrin repeat domain-containing protein [Leptospira weilii]EMY77581.1 ankyrin repeat protein [Leptospira weilii serovar Ranarum str. ICFT]